MEQTETAIKTEIATLTEGMEFLSVTTRPELGDYQPRRSSAGGSIDSVLSF